ncbi:MAG: hypothetical protein N2Z74_02330 [Syntrophales bacterium]|nr:hypothetical protein [Syntrophales bacterium]
MDDIHTIRQRNREIALRYRSLEARVAKAADVEELFAAWHDGMAEAFAIPYLWISLIDDPVNDRLMAVLLRVPALRGLLNTVDPAEFVALLPHGPEPVLANGDLRRFYKLLPSKNKYFVRSIAVAPFYMDRSIVGSLNHGDHVPHRYEPDMDTHFLKKFMACFSERLSALMNTPSASE